MMNVTASNAAKLRRRWREAGAVERRRLIIDAAMELLRQRGPSAMTMRRVAARLGVGTMTLYTYIDGQAALHREMTRAGFDMLHQNCQAQSTLQSAAGPNKWRGGAKAYLDFALKHPNLYKLMFDVPLNGIDEENELLHGGFQALLDRVREQLGANGLRGAELDRQANIAAGRFWIALHGLATLLIAGRTGFLKLDPDQLLDDLLARVAPT